MFLTGSQQCGVRIQRCNRENFIDFSFQQMLTLDDEVYEVKVVDNYIVFNNA